MPTFFEFDPKITTKITSTWFHLCNKKDFQSLAQYVAEFRKKEGWIKKFFEKEGSFLLYEAVISSTNSDQLDFIVKNIPESDIANALARKDYEIIKDLIFIENNAMLTGRSSDKRITDFKEKLALLLSIEEARDDIIEVLNEVKFTTEEPIPLCDSMKDILSSCLPQSNELSLVRA